MCLRLHMRRGSVSKRESEKLGRISKIPFSVFTDTGSILQDGETDGGFAAEQFLTNRFKSDL